MCGVCGCSERETTTVMQHAHDDEVIHVEQNIMAKNESYAEQNRQYFDHHHITALNIMSSPGSGKTTLLAKTMQDLATEILSSAVVGDQQTDADAQLFQASGQNALQINTGKVCHLDAHMLGHALETLQPQENSLLLIENIGNLVCPALFNLGEHKRVVILSVTEGENKPLKYPDMFRIADLVLITKSDLLPYLDFDLDQCKDYVQRIQPKADTIILSTKNGEGLTLWYDWLRQAMRPA